MKMECMYHQRNALKTTINDNGCIATTFEEDLELEYASLQEQIILREIILSEEDSLEPSEFVAKSARAGWYN